jgi:hypothetical protein
MAEDTRKRPDFSSDYSSTPAKPGGDPLAELARLIGQSDPFTELKGRGAARNPLDNLRAGDRPAPEWLARPAPSADHGDEHETVEPHGDRDGHDDYEDTESYDAHDDRGYAAQDPRPAERYDDTAHARGGYNGARQPVGEAYDVGGDDRYRVALPAADDYETDSYYTEDGHMPPHEEGEAPARKRGGLVTIAAVFGLAVIGTAGAFGYRAFTAGSSVAGTPPVIKADTTPAKTVPPAAPNVDAQGKPFQDRIAALAAPERVVQREEQPVALPVAPPSMTAPRQSGQSAAPLTAPAPPANANEPKRVRTMTIRPDGADATASAPLPASPAAGPGATRSVAPPAKQPTASGPMAIAPQSEPQPDPTSRTKVAARTPPAQAAGGAYVVQVSAQRSEAEAQSSYQALQAKYPGVLGGRSANIRRVDLGDKGGVYYRAQVGTFASSEQATTFCNNLKDAGGQCIVQKN